MKRAFALFATGLCILLLAVACGDDDDGTAPITATIDSCQLVTQEEAAEALGAPVNSGEGSDLGNGYHQCLYRSAGGTQFDSVVTIQARGSTSRAQYQQLLAELCPQELGEPTPVDDLGDVAHQCVATFVLEGDALVLVTVINNEDPPSGPPQQPVLARKAIDRLP